MVSLAVLGAGNAGCSLAGEMTLEGHDVSLAELPQFKTNLEVPVRKGGIEVAGELKTGFAKIKKMTMDIKDAIKGRELDMTPKQVQGNLRQQRLLGSLEGSMKQLLP